MIFGHRPHLEDGRLSDERDRLLRIFEPRHLDVDAVGADLGKRDLGDAKPIEAGLEHLQLFILKIACDRGVIGRRLELDERAQAALQVKTEVDGLAQRRRTRARKGRTARRST